MNDEPKIDIERFQFAHGHAADFLKHIKEWVHWKMSGPDLEKPTTRGPVLLNLKDTPEA